MSATCWNCVNFVSSHSVYVALHCGADLSMSSPITPGKGSSSPPTHVSALSLSLLPSPPPPPPHPSLSPSVVPALRASVVGCPFHYSCTVSSSQLGRPSAPRPSHSTVSPSHTFT